MPKTHNNLWPQIASWENVYAAYLEAVAGKRYHLPALKVRADLEEYLINILNHLIWGTWRPGPFRAFYVYEPKKRLIHAPALKDRIVHHALVRVIEPLFEQKFIYDSYACRRGKGTQQAVKRLQGFLRRAQRKWGKVYVFKADISKYFASVPPGGLMRVLVKTIRDQRVLGACRLIIDHGAENGRGLPVGALTSQLFANAYLDQLDHYAKDQMGLEFYLRYMDDWVVLGQDKRALAGIKSEIESMLDDRLRLRLNPKTDIFPASHGVDFCGYRTWSTHVLPRKTNVKRAKKRFKKLSAMYATGLATRRDAEAVLASFLGYMKHCDCRRIRKNTVKHLILKKGDALMIFTQEHQVFDRVAAGADMESIADMVSDYLKGEKYRQMVEDAGGEPVDTASIPETADSEVVEWLAENYAELRRVSYPDWRSQMEMIYEDKAAWEDEIARIKTRFPKTAASVQLS